VIGLKEIECARGAYYKGVWVIGHIVAIGPNSTWEYRQDVVASMLGEGRQGDCILGYSQLVHQKNYK
jgi:hypothetical protein